MRITTFIAALMVLILLTGCANDSATGRSSDDPKAKPPMGRPPTFHDLATTFQLESPTVESPVFSKSLQRRVTDATVRILQDKSVGTGTIVGRDDDGVWILTAWHVIDSGDPIQIELFRYEVNVIQRFEQGIEIVSRLPRADLALIRLNTDEPMPMPIRICPPDTEPQGDIDVFGVGCELGAAPSAVACRTDGTTRVKGMDGTMWRTTGRAIPGRSGSALVDERGYVIGVCLQRRPDGTGVYQGIDEIRRVCNAAGQARLHAGRGLPRRDVAIIVGKIVMVMLFFGLLLRDSDPLVIPDSTRGAIVVATVIVIHLIVLGWAGSIAHGNYPIRSTIAMLVVQSLVTWLVAHLAKLRHPGDLPFLCGIGILLVVLFPGSTSLVRLVVGSYYFGHLYLMFRLPSGNTSKLSNAG